MKDYAIAFIKIADQIDNLSTMECFAQEKKNRKKQEVLQYFLPMYFHILSFIPQEYRYAYSLLIEQLQDVLKKEENYCLVA